MPAALAVGAVLAAGVWTGTAADGTPGGDETPPAASVTVPVARPQRPSTLEEELAAKADPVADVWPTEVLNGAAGAELKALGRLIESPEPIRAGDLAALVAAGFVSSALRPLELGEVFDDGVVTVRRWRPAPAVPRHRRAEGLAAALTVLRTGWGTAASGWR